MPFNNSLSVIEEEVDSSNSSNDMYGLGIICDTDTDSETTLQGQEMSNGEANPSFQSQIFVTTNTTNSDPAVTDAVLTLTDDVIAIAGRLYAIAGDKYAADEHMLEVPRIRYAGNGTGEAAEFDRMADLNQRDKVALAQKQLKVVQGRLDVARAQAILAESRLKVARSQVQLAEDRVESAIEQFESARRKA